MIPMVNYFISPFPEKSLGNCVGRYLVFFCKKKYSIYYFNTWTFKMNKYPSQFEEQALVAKLSYQKATLTPICSAN